MFKFKFRKQAKLPLDRQEINISRMPMGKVFYTVHWAMWVDLDRNLWLNPEYNFREKPEGTASMAIIRNEDGYHVKIKDDEKYSPVEQPSYSQTNRKWIPVSTLNGEIFNEGENNVVRT